MSIFLFCGPHALMNSLASAWQFAQCSNCEISQPSIVTPWYLAPQEGQPTISSVTGDLHNQQIVTGWESFSCSSSIACISSIIGRGVNFCGKGAAFGDANWFAEGVVSLLINGKFFSSDLLFLYNTTPIKDKITRIRAMATPLLMNDSLAVPIGSPSAETSNDTLGFESELDCSNCSVIVPSPGRSALTLILTTFD